MKTAITSHRLLMLAALGVAGFMAGCASQDSKHNDSTTNPAMMSQKAATDCKAECLVCKKNADLACIDVQVGSDTPKYAYDGKTYYFCSDDCKNEFAKHPAKYLK